MIVGVVAYTASAMMVVLPGIASIGGPWLGEARHGATDGSYRRLIDGVYSTLGRIILLRSHNRLSLQALNSRLSGVMLCYVGGDLIAAVESGGQRDAAGGATAPGRV